MIYLVHHGEAVGPEVNPLRPLSERGLLNVETLARQAAQRGAKPSMVWHSGKLRARQTAEIFWRHCNALATFTATNGLRPSDPVAWVIQALAGETRDVMLVGHFPLLPRLLAALRAGDVDSDRGFPLNGLVALEESEGRWVERWRLEGPR